jgi:hypothetical protein
MTLLISNKISPRLGFQSDPEFPKSIKRRSTSAKIELFQSLFTNYSKFEITVKTDRPVAILSLAKALAEALNTKVHYGIFECFLHRSLLWQSAQKTPLTQIDYKATPSKALPSWSWMAYHGHIQYLPIKFGDVEWDDSVQLVEVKASDAATSPKDDRYVLKARVRRLRDCKIKPEGVILNEEDKEVGQLYFDTQPGNVLLEVRCAIMGREDKAKDENRTYYVLFLTKCATQLGRGRFKRVGMGTIKERFILFVSRGGRAQIL